MNEYIEFFNWQTSILDDIDNDLDNIKTRYPATLNSNDDFALYRIDNQKIINDLQPYFNFDVTKNIYYQVVGVNFAIHKDSGRDEAWNYILDTGGDDVFTAWYTQRHNPTLLYELVIPKNTWHRIRTDIHHNVYGQTRKRLAISVWQSENAFPELP